MDENEQIAWPRVIGVVMLVFAGLLAVGAVFGVAQWAGAERARMDARQSDRF